MVHSQEHFAWLLCYSWSALISAFSLSVTSPGTLEIAKAAQDKDGNVAFGLKWSNAIATMATVGSLTLVVLAPILGSLADYTHHRKLFGTISVCLVVVCCIPWFFPSEEILGVLIVAGICSLVAYLSAYQFLRAPYLPELAATPEDVNRLSGRGYLILFSSQVFFLGLLSVVGNLAGDDLFNALRIQTGVVVFFSIILLGVIIPRYGKRGPTSTLKPGESLGLVGFKSVWTTYRDMRDNYTQLKRFTFFTACANASFNAAPALATTFMVQLGSSPNEITGSLGAALVFGILGPLLFTYLQKYKIHVRTILLFDLLFYCITILIFPIIAPQGFAFIVVGGIMIGISSGVWLSSGQAFFAILVPGGQEATFTGMYIFANKILDWLPPLLFVIINQTTGSITFAMYGSVLIFVVTAAIVLFSIDTGKAALEVKESMSKRRVVKQVELGRLPEKNENDRSGIGLPSPAMDTA